MCLSLRIIRHGWTSGSLRRGGVSVTSPTRATTRAGRSTPTSTAWFTPNTSSWRPTWTTWKKIPSGEGEGLKDCHGDFLIKLWERWNIPSRNAETLIRWRTGSLRRKQSGWGGEKNLYHDTLLQATGSQTRAPQERRSSSFCTISKHSMDSLQNNRKQDKRNASVTVRVILVNTA